MSKPHVWVVELKSSGEWVHLPRYTFYLKSEAERYIAGGRGSEFSAYATYRAAKYARGEPTAKRRKGK